MGVKCPKTMASDFLESTLGFYPKNLWHPLLVRDSPESRKVLAASFFVGDGQMLPVPFTMLGQELKMPPMMYLKDPNGVKAVSVSPKFAQRRDYLRGCSCDLTCLRCQKVSEQYPSARPWMGARGFIGWLKVSHEFARWWNWSWPSIWQPVWQGHADKNRTISRKYVPLG